MPVQRRRLACNVKEVRLECVHTAYKGGLISESFSISKKKVSNHYPEYNPIKENMLKIVIFEDGAKVKHFLILSYL